MLTAFVAGVNAFFAFLGFVTMLIVVLGFIGVIIAFIEMRKANKQNEE